MFLTLSQSACKQALNLVEHLTLPSERSMESLFAGYPPDYGNLVWSGKNGSCRHAVTHFPATVVKKIFEPATRLIQPAFLALPQFKIHERQFTGLDPCPPWPLIIHIMGSKPDKINVSQ